MLLIKNGHIKTMADKEYESGCILVDGGKIVEIAEVIESSSDYTVIDAEGRLVTPGCIDAHCHIGLEGMGW